jgi:hypothetical protein
MIHMIRKSNFGQVIIGDAMSNDNCHCLELSLMSWCQFMVGEVLLPLKGT